MQVLLSWQRIRITGYSMTPTLLPGDLVLVRHGAPVRPGDVVLARFRSRPELLVIKRAVRPVPGGWLVSSDNTRAGADSRQHGVAEVAAIAVRTWRPGAGRIPGAAQLPDAGRLPDARRRPERLVRRWLGRPLPPAPPAGL